LYPVLRPQVGEVFEADGVRVGDQVTGGDSLLAELAVLELLVAAEHLQVVLHDLQLLVLVLFGGSLADVFHLELVVAEFLHVG